MIKPFALQSSREVLKTPIFTLREDLATHPRTGREGRYVVLESPAWVNVVALDEAGRLILVRQWRHGIRAVELELPAGLVDGDESPLEAAARELREETGYEAASLRLIGEVAANPAYQDNRCATVLAEGCRLTGPTDLDEGEDIEIELHTPREAQQLLARGELRNAMSVCALLWWREDVLQHTPW
jgi:ADP-ribose pyrophosphatase